MRSAEVFRSPPNDSSPLLFRLRRRVLGGARRHASAWRVRSPTNDHAVYETILRLKYNTYEETQVEALTNLHVTFAVLNEAYTEKTLEIPPPNPQLPISVAQLSVASAVVKVSKVAELAGINVQTLAAKVKRGTEFSPSESSGIAKALATHGLAILSTGQSAKGATSLPSEYLEWLAVKWPQELSEAKPQEYAPAASGISRKRGGAAVGTLRKSGAGLDARVRDNDGKITRRSPKLSHRF